MAAMAIAKYSVTLDDELVAAARKRMGPAGLSGYLNDALAWKLQNETLREWLSEMRAVHGVTPESVRKEVDELWESIGSSSTAVASPPSQAATSGRSRSSKKPSRKASRSRFRSSS